MYGILSYLLGAVVVLTVVYYLLPRDPSLHHEHGRLALRPPLRQLLGESTAELAGLFVAAHLTVPLLAGRLLSGLVVVGLIMGWLVWRLWRRWRSGGVCFDREADVIRRGPATIGRASTVAGVQITGEPAPALQVFLHDEAEGVVLWPVPGVGAQQAAGVGRAIADYLHVPLVTRLITPVP
jgi:hypothetical protein